MSGEKTEKATPKRRKDEKEKGNILKSIEVNSAVILILAFSGFKIFGGQMLVGIREVFYTLYSKSYLDGREMSIAEYQSMFIMLTKSFLMIISPILLIAFVTGLVINYLQVGFIFLPKMLAFKFSKINPLSGIKKLFSMRSFVEMIKSILKMSIVGYVAYSEIASNYAKFANLVEADVYQSCIIVSDIVMGIAFKAGVTLLILSIFDYAYQWWEYEKNMKMSKQEIQDEYKLMEGDPKIKQKVREIQRQMGMKRMMQEVPKADVVITNPIHFAVAIKYDQNENDAPIVIAKGQDYVAQKIKEIARENKVEVVENKPLARSLYGMTELGQEIPDELFGAVAEILAMVYSANPR